MSYFALRLPEVSFLRFVSIWRNNITSANAVRQEVREPRAVLLGDDLILTGVFALPPPEQLVDFSCDQQYPMTRVGNVYAIAGAFPTTSAPGKGQQWRQALNT